MFRKKIETKKSTEIPDNRIGGDYGGDYPIVADELYDLGLKWVRTAFWGDTALNWHRVRRAPGTYFVAAEAEQYITELATGGITFILNLGVGLGADRPKDTWLRTPEEMDDYREYAQFMVRHFKDRVQYYEIWNEPDSGTPWGRIAAVDYAALIKHTVPAIRGEYTEAKVVIGATGGWWQQRFPGYGMFGRYSFHRDYLMEVICSGVATLVDGISWHPLYGHRADDPYYRNYPKMVEEIKALATDHGFTGEYLVEEILWRTEQAPEDPSKAVSGVVSAKYLARAIVMHLGLDVIVAVSPILPGRCPEVFRRLCTVLAGARSLTFPIEIRTRAPNLKHYSFSLPNGDQLIALWMNDVPVEDAPCVSAVLFCRGLAAKEVTSIDVLDGFEQELLFETEDDGTVIQNLQVPDYPLILRLKSPL